ncbi:MAG: lysylphosphatidylglycerol synthase transmembrane domain-containing protein [Planctomycetota bacterium]
MPNNPKSKRSRHIATILRVIVAVVAIVLVSRGQDWNELARIFASLNLWYFVLSLAVFVLSQFLVTFRWWLLLRTHEIFIDYKAALWLHYLGLFYNNFMPGSLGGDLIRAWYVTRHTESEKKMTAALSVFIDRLNGLFGMLIIGSVSYFCFLHGKVDLTISASGRQKSIMDSMLEYRFLVIGIVLILVLALSILFSLQPGRKILRKLWNYVRVHGRMAFEKLKESLTIYCKNPLAIVAAVSLTLLVQMLVITSFWILGLNLGIEASAKYYFVIFPTTWLIGSIPISVGGLGVFEGLIVELFKRLAGVARESVFALAICQRLVFVICSLPGLVIHIIGAHLPKDFFVDYKQTLD